MMAGVLQDLHNLPRQHTSPRQQLHAASCAAPAVAQAPAAASSSMAAPQPASTQELLPVFDLAAFLALAPGQQPPPELMQQCRDVARCLEETGCVVVRLLDVPPCVRRMAQWLCACMRLPTALQRCCRPLSRPQKATLGAWRISPPPPHTHTLAHDM
jgi:hypothetical protein